jgi:hypothetical protein
VADRPGPADAAAGARPARRPGPARAAAHGVGAPPSPTPAPRRPTWRPPCSATSRAPRCSPGTGPTTPSRSARSAVRSTTPRSARTWSSTGCCATACSAPPASSTA